MLVNKLHILTVVHILNKLNDSKLTHWTKNNDNTISIFMAAVMYTNV